MKGLFSVFVGTCYALLSDCIDADGNLGNGMAHALDEPKLKRPPDSFQPFGPLRFYFWVFIALRFGMISLSGSRSMLVVSRTSGFRQRSNERRRKTGVVADSFGVVRRVESSVRDAFGVVTEIAEFAEGAHAAPAVVHLDDAVVVWVTDQRVTVLQPHGARWQWASASRQVASCTVTGEVLPYNVLIFIDLDDTGVIGISDQRVAVLKPTGEGETTDWFVLIRVTAAILPNNLFGARDLDSTVVIFVADKNVTILQKLCAVRAVELVGTVAGDARRAILPDNSLGRYIDLNDSLVCLIGDEHVAVGKPGVLYGNVELIWATTSDTKLPILPNDVPGAVDQ